MAWQRKTPFGYQIQNGRITCHPEEAESVRYIFSHYLLGSSYNQIADEMAQQGVRYHQHTAQWNKHMVKRILENERYRRVIWTQKGVKRVVWRCQNRLEHGRKICKHSPTLDEGNIHDAVISAMNELFQTQAARDAVKASISAVLAGEEQTLSLPAVELQIRNLQERQLELFQLIVSAGADCTDYDEELRQVNMAKTKLMAKKAELEKEQRGAAAFEERLAELDAELEQSCGALTDFDELTVRQLVSNIKVLDKDSLLICFKDGTEITQAMQRRQTA